MTRPSEDAQPNLTAHYCFGCGELNPIGLHLRFERDGDEVVARYAPRPEDQGFPGMMHGGLVAVMLDEAMGWAMYIDRVFAVTARMETRYRSATGLDAPLEVRARITRRAGRRIEVEARLLDGMGVVLVESSGLFLRMSPQQEAEALEAMGRGASAGDHGPV